MPQNIWRHMWMLPNSILFSSKLIIPNSTQLNEKFYCIQKSQLLYHKVFQFFHHWNTKRLFPGINFVFWTLVKVLICIHFLKGCLFSEGTYFLFFVPSSKECVPSKLSNNTAIFSTQIFVYLGKLLYSSRVLNISVTLLLFYEIFPSNTFLFGTQFLDFSSTLLLLFPEILPPTLLFGLIFYVFGSIRDGAR